MARRTRKQVPRPGTPSAFESPGPRRLRGRSSAPRAAQSSQAGPAWPVLDRKESEPPSSLLPPGLRPRAPFPLSLEMRGAHVLPGDPRQLRARGHGLSGRGKAASPAGPSPHSRARPAGVGATPPRAPRRREWSAGNNARGGSSAGPREPQGGTAVARSQQKARPRQPSCVPRLRSREAGAHDPTPPPRAQHGRTSPGGSGFRVRPCASLPDAMEL